MRRWATAGLRIDGCAAGVLAVIRRSPLRRLLWIDDLILNTKHASRPSGPPFCRPSGQLQQTSHQTFAVGFTYVEDSTTRVPPAPHPPTHPRCRRRVPTSRARQEVLEQLHWYCRDALATRLLHCPCASCTSHAPPALAMRLLH